jgi:dTDP-glucose 4,6-dehydratase
MRILVTGGAGFIGSNLVHYLLEKHEGNRIETVVNLDALTYAGNPENIREITDSRHVFAQGSIGDEKLVEDLLTRHRIQAVMNLAAETHVDRSIDTPEPFVQTNVVGTLRLLASCRRHWNKLGAAEKKQFRFLHVSTDEVFGSLEPSDPPFSETTSYSPRSPYSASKAASDHLVRAYGHTYDLPVLLTNCSNNYGPRQFPEKLIPLMILNLLENRPVPVYGDGLQCRDWLYVRDHCRALELVLRNGAPGETYMIGGESELPNLKMVHLICDILDRQAPRKDGQSHRAGITHVADRPGHDRRYAVSIDKIRRTLGWRPEETLATGLEATVLWYLKNRDWSEAVSKGKYDRRRLGTS